MFADKFFKNFFIANIFYKQAREHVPLPNLFKKEDRYISLKIKSKSEGFVSKNIRLSLKQIRKGVNVNMAPKKKVQKRKLGGKKRK